MCSHRCHDYPFLMRRWRAVARKARLPLEMLCEEDGLPLYFLRGGALQPGGGATGASGIYLSAGIHGDEPAATEALITWAETHMTELRTLPVLILPCLNPWGLLNNSRLDAHGIDLNRVFHLEAPAMVGHLKSLLKPYQFEVALMLHEDFDAQGLYLYELQRQRPYWGEALLEVARPLIAIEGRAKVDGRKAAAGLIRRRFGARRALALGYPEAIWLHLHHSRRSFTLETPSEFALEERVRAQVAIIEECVARALRAHSTP